MDYEEVAEFDKFDCCDAPYLNFLSTGQNPYQTRESAPGEAIRARVELPKKVSARAFSAEVFV
ncbi:hypothetical protein VOI32_01800 [Paraburkholderia caribensis]|jgi:hypothetical protein|uniref:Uncharacterized protein n=1 Tax=Paraburkholderia caribensis TaxID=75105 RepID=A0ABV0DNI8_9BURK|nr:hypothetical protein [Paraburkholderia caribensis]MCO4882075.1 hypothetical protein [Paraburkholderia caribensis]